MTSVRLLAGAVALALACSAQGAAPTDSFTHASAKIADEAVYIVVFEGKPVARQAATRLQAKSGGARFDPAASASLAHRAKLASDRSVRLTHAERLLGRDLRPLAVYEYATNGVALQLSSAEARQIAALPGVLRVERERRYQLQTDKGPAWIGAPSIWNGPAGIANRGEGVVIGVIDSGINASHPSFAAVGPVDGFAHANPRGQRYGLCASGAGICNDKLIGMYDFTDEGVRNGSDVDGHGTHVASTAAGNTLRYSSSNGEVQISGVAPHANLISYKACVADDPDTDEDEGHCPGSDLLQAIDQATEDGVDVINYSISGGGSDPWVCFGVDCGNDGLPVDTTAEAFLGARVAGIVPVSAAGNDGPDPGTVGFPAIAPWMLTVAAIRHDRSPGFADALAEFSSRGPGPAGGLVPDVAAPGVSILAADGDSNDAVTKSGTSMASPHVAGGAALLLGAHPTWTAGDVMSALVSTARPEATLADLTTPANVWEQGAGIVDLGQAVNAGLSLSITGAEYEQASPALGGQTAALNEPAMILDACFRTCIVERRVTDLVGGGTWRVAAQTEDGITVTATPSEFTLAPGATQAISFAVGASERAGEWTYGEVRLEPVSGVPSGTPDARLPLAVFSDPGNIPASIVIDATTDAGFVDLDLEGIVDLPQARFASTGFGEATTLTRNLREDPTNTDPFDNVAGELAGAFQERITIPPNSPPRTLVVRTSSAASQDVDLFVGIDSDKDFEPSENELQCASTTPDATEYCEVRTLGVPVELTYWIVVQNWKSSAPGASDAVTLEYLRYDPEIDGAGALTVSGPGHVDGEEPFRVRLSWADFTLTPGAVRAGELLIGSTPERLGQTAVIPVTLRRSVNAATAPHALQPGVPLDVRLLADEAEDRLYIDVPPNASSLTMSIDGSGEVDLFAAHLPAAGGPVIAAAPPRDAAQAHSSAAGANDTLTVSGAQLVPGRWYLTPVNSGTDSAEFTLQVELAYDSAHPDVQFGAYYNVERSGAGGFLYSAGDAWAFLWYTFLQDGTPAWYLGSATQPGAQQGTWAVPLYRYSWDGDSTHAVHVGDAVLSLQGPAAYRFSWNLDGQSGSELYQWIDAGGCPDATPNDLTGSWYAPAQSGYGYSVNAHPGLETNAAYFYDDQGVARWAFGAGEFGTETLALQQFSGSGPLAPYTAPMSVEVGSYTRSYTSNATGSAALDVELVAPLSGSWSTSHGIEKLTDNLGCTQ